MTGFGPAPDLLGPASPDGDDQTEQNEYSRRLRSRIQEHRLTSILSGAHRVPKQLLASGLGKAYKLSRIFQSRHFILQHLRKVDIRNGLYARLRPVNGRHSLDREYVRHSEDEKKLLSLLHTWDSMKSQLETIFADPFDKEVLLKAAMAEGMSDAHQFQGSKRAVAFWRSLAVDNRDLFSSIPGLQIQLKMQQKLFQLIYDWELQVFENYESAGSRATVVRCGSATSRRTQAMVEYLERFFSPFVLGAYGAGHAVVYFRHRLNVLCAEACQLHNLLLHQYGRYAIKVYNPSPDDVGAETRISRLHDFVHILKKSDVLESAEEELSHYQQRGEHSDGVLHMVLCGGLQSIEKQYSRVDGDSHLDGRVVCLRRAVATSCQRSERALVRYKYGKEG